MLRKHILLLISSILPILFLIDLIKIQELIGKKDMFHLLKMPIFSSLMELP